MPLRELGKALARTARLMVGVGDYEAWAEHRRAHHPAEPVPSREEFRRMCAERRFDGRPGKGCC
ncbi:MAG TPA: YbdD/YjiX family protein [Allosphingosinicella sp.]|jgi:uncharacterized short protein YbdD (DUF466 family)